MGHIATTGVPIAIGIGAEVAGNTGAGLGLCATGVTV